MDKEWRCFHCDEVFTDRKDAALHFGVSEDQEPLCVIFTAVEKDIWRALRQAEDRAAECLHLLHAESSDAMQAYRDLHYRFYESVRLAEQKGYDKGLHDRLVEIAALVMSAGGKVKVSQHSLLTARDKTLLRYSELPFTEVYEIKETG